MNKLQSSRKVYFSRYFWIYDDDNELFYGNGGITKDLKSYFQSWPDTPRTRFKHVQNVSSGFVEWSFAVITTTPSGSSNHYSNLFSNTQLGFKPSYSCVNQRISITHSIFCALDTSCSLEVCDVFSILSKIFYRVWGEGLMYKIKQNGIKRIWD